MRNYGRFTTSIWRDPDFTSLTLEQQAVYFTLGLQPDVSAAGSLPLTARRWAKLSAGTTRDQIENLVAGLADHAGHHIVVDDDTEELLIRKFIKWDGGWSNSKRLPVVMEAVRSVASDLIRLAAVDELRKLAASAATSEEAKRSREALSVALSPFDRLRVAEGEYLLPQPLTAIQGGEPPIADASAGPPSMFCSKHPNGTERSCGPCGTAKLRYAAWVKSTAGKEAEARRAAAEAVAACADCDDKGFVLDPATKKPQGRCNHRRTA